MRKFIRHLIGYHALLLSSFLLCTHSVPCAKGGGLEAKTERPDNVALHVSWEKEDKVKSCNGSFSLKTVGEMSLEPLKEQAYTIFQKYVNNSGTAIYDYAIQCVEKEPDPPNKECPLLYEFHGSGSAPFVRSDLQIQNFGDLMQSRMLAAGKGAQQFFSMLQAQAPQVALRYYGYAGSFGTRIMYGKRRSYKNNCEYDDAQDTVSLGGVGVRFKLPEKMEMRGFMHWRAKSESENPSLKVTVSDLPKTMEKFTHKPSQNDAGNVSYTVSWNFDDCNCLPYVEPLEAEDSSDIEPTIWEDMAQKYGCISATNMLYQDLAWMESFADVDLRQQSAPNDIKGYRADVKQSAQRILNENQPSIAANWPVSLEMWIDDDCKVKGVKKAQELAKQFCLPDIIFEELLAHEQLHVDQCLTNKKFGIKKMTVPKYGRDETHAHAKGIDKILDWLENKCNQSLQDDIANARERFNTVKTSEGYTGF